MIKTNNPEIDVEELMHRIRDEVAQRKAASCMAEDLADVEKPRFSANVEKIAGEEIPAFKLNLQELSPFAVQPAFEAKADGQYHVNDLLCYHDQAFVNVAYRTVLRRSPDTNGCLHYLNMLRNGCAKIDILGRLRYSKEGREVEAKYPDLPFPFYFSRYTAFLFSDVLSKSYPLSGICPSSNVISERLRIIPFCSWNRPSGNCRILLRNW